MRRTFFFFLYAIGKDWEFPMAWCITHILCLFIYRFIYIIWWVSIFSALFRLCFVCVCIGFPLCRERVRIFTFRRSVCAKIGTKLIWSRWNVLQCTCDICISTTDRKCFQRNRTTLKKRSNLRANEEKTMSMWKRLGSKMPRIYCQCLLLVEHL